MSTTDVYNVSLQSKATIKQPKKRLNVVIWSRNRRIITHVIVDEALLCKTAQAIYYQTR